MNKLYTAFEGETNSSKILLDCIDSNNKLYLKNYYKESVLELEKELMTKEYDLVISLGQAPLKKDYIQIETTGKKNNEYQTTYDYSELVQSLSSNFHVTISNNAGNYLCNNLYYHGLKIIEENNLKTKMIFIHIPKINKLTKIEELSKILKNLHTNAS